MAIVNLCRVPFLDKNYVNVVDFSSSTTRRNYFTQRTYRQCNSNTKLDTERTEITLDLPYNAFETFDYLFFTSQSGKDIFYFVDNIRYNTGSTIIVDVTLDVFTTFMFDFTFLPSYVERCHVNRWKTSGKTPTNEVVDEDFPDYTKVIKKTKALDRKDGSYIYVATTPLGKIEGSRPSIGGGGEIGGGCQANGIPSYNGFRFIKGYEAFSDYGLYLNGESFKTVGYGFTEIHNKSVFDLHKPFPCSEQLASELFGEYFINDYASKVWNALVNNGVSELISINMFDAMCSLAWNRGVNGFLGDSTSPFQLIKENPLNPNIEDCWKKYAITSSGNVLQGLVNRRQAEVNIYFRNDYEMRKITWYTDNGQNLGIATSKGYVTDNNGDGYIPPHFEKCSSGDFINPTTKDEHGSIWQFPTTGTVTATYPEYPNGGTHTGIDIGGNNGQPIYSSGFGKILKIVVSTEGYGKHVIVSMNNTTRHYFGHMQSFASGIHEGMSVTPQTLLGYVGSTGNSTGPHLHWEIRVSPYAYDLTSCINPSPSSKVGDIIKGGVS